jgi:hypothetical protein
MSVEANKAVVTRYWQDFWNQKQGDLISEITTRKTSSYISHQVRPISRLRLNDGLKPLSRRFRMCTSRCTISLPKATK